MAQSRNPISQCNDTKTSVAPCVEMIAEHIITKKPGARAVRVVVYVLYRDEAVDSPALKLVLYTVNVTTEYGAPDRNSRKTTTPRRWFDL
jgi:hypothetical protein